MPEFPKSFDFWTSSAFGSRIAKNTILAALGFFALAAIAYQITYGDFGAPKLEFSRPEDLSSAIRSSRGGGDGGDGGGARNRSESGPIVEISSLELVSNASAPSRNSSGISPISSEKASQSVAFSSPAPSPSEAPSPAPSSVASAPAPSMFEQNSSAYPFVTDSSLEISPSPPPFPELFVNTTQNHRKVPEWRTSLEQALREAKLSIETATESNTALDRLLTKSIYNDAFKFQRSYELMESMFRIYTYKEGQPRLVHVGPLVGIYSSEGRFIHEMNHNARFVTDDPHKAHMFFLPYSVAHMVLDLYVPNSHTMLPLATFIKNYVDDVAAKHPFWNMTHGADHFFVSCHDWGPATARDHHELRKNAVKVVCNADTTEEYVASKDVSLPETYLHSQKLPTRFGGPGASKRPILAFFAGQMHGHVRPVLLQHWKDKDPDMRIFEVLPKEVAKTLSYEGHMKSSKFCICAAGYEVNSPRIVEAIYYECVPVLIADNFVLPFSDVLNWGAFSITVPERDIPRLKEILTGVSPGRYNSMQAKLKRVRQHFVWHETAQRFDMFHMILHSVWMRRLQQLDRIVGLEEGVVEG